MRCSGTHLRSPYGRPSRPGAGLGLVLALLLALPLRAGDLTGTSAPISAGFPAEPGGADAASAVSGTIDRDDVESRLQQLESDLQMYRAENQSLRNEVDWLNARAHSEREIPPAARSGSRIPLSPYWDRQLRFESGEGNWCFHVGGDLQWDSVWLIGPDSVFAVPGGGQNGATNNPATLIRRGRFRFGGSIYEQIDYVLEFDLANAVNENKGLQDPTVDNISTSPAPKNVWVQIRDFYCLGDVRIGQQKKPIGLENNTSHLCLPFLERSYNMDAFYGPFDSGYTTGIMSINRLESGRMTWRYGLFRPLENTFGVAINNWQAAGRATALPLYDDAGARLVHVGLGALYGDLVQDERRFRARPVLRNGPGYAVPLMVDTEDVPARNHVQLCPEFAAVAGPLTLQAEYAVEWINDVTVANPSQQTAFFHGGYCEALYFLTGEHQAYDFDTASFTRVVPRHNARIREGRGEACGAWQAGLRFSFLDLDDRSIRGGQVYDWTVGLNWFLNPNTKLQFNYMLLHRDGQQNVAEGWINGFGTRVAVDF